MVGVTTATIIILLSGGGDVEHFLTEVKKGVKEHIEDKDRRKIILSESKDLSKDLKKLGKQIDRHFEDVSDVHADFHSGEDDFDAATAQLVNDQKVLSELILDARDNMKAQMTREEWEAVFAAPEE